VIAPTAPSAPASPFEQAKKEPSSNKPADTVSPSESAEIAPPSGPFVEKKLVEKPTAPQKPVLSKPVVTQEVEKKQQDQTSNAVQKHVAPIQLNLDVKAPKQPEMPQAAVKPESPKIVEKPTEMTAPQKQKGNSHTSHASSMSMPSMNMKMPATSMGTTVAPQTVSAPSVSVQPVEKPATTPTQVPVTEH
jgi:hypothetical protein